MEIKITRSNSDFLLELHKVFWKRQNKKNFLIIGLFAFIGILLLAGGADIVNKTGTFWNAATCFEISFLFLFVKYGLDLYRNRLRSIADAKEYIRKENAKRIHPEITINDSEIR